MAETFIIDEPISVDEIETPAEQDETVKYCLNCGTEVTDRFCPHCGQSTSTPSKLKMKNFGKGLIMSFGRLTPGFFNTAKGLLFHPWTVIRDHIHGKHVPYSPPFTIIIQITLYSTLIFAGLDSILGTHSNVEESLFGYEGDNPFFKLLDTSVVLTALLIGIPFSFGVYLAYYRHGAKKYNFAEYLAAFMYLFASIGLWDNLLQMVGMITGIDFDFENLAIIVAVLFSSVILFKAFPQKKRWISIALYLWCSFIMFICLLFVGMIMVLPRLIRYISENI